MADDKKVAAAKADTHSDDNVTAEEAKQHVTVHLDRDPNDPRNAVPAEQLPSLDDESQQTPKDYDGKLGKW